MNKSLFLLPLMALLLLVGSCDDGDIHEKVASVTTGKVVKLEGRVIGLRSYTRHYDVSIAGFTEEAESQALPYATISKVLTADSAGNVSIVLSGITGAVKDVELCVLNSLRQRVVTFVSEDISNLSAGDTIRMNIGTVDVSMLSALQTGLFNTSCVGCHGANGFSGAGLNLTATDSLGYSSPRYSMLVNHPSTKLPDQNRVTPGDADHSVLFQVINDSTFSQSWRENHADILNKDRAYPIISMMREWIDEGAAQ